MAKTLSNLGIATGQTIKASEVSQSIDALTGTEAYDITISGSLTVTGSTSIDGDVFINPTSATTGTSVLTINPTTGKIFRTGSYSAGGGGSVGNLNQVTTLGNSTTNAISIGALTATSGTIGGGLGAVNITSQNTIVAGTDISASGNLFANLADNGTTTFKTVVYDPATGKFYRTGSFSSALTSEGGKFDVGDDEIVFDDGTGNEGAGLKGDGTDTILIEKADGTGGKLDVGGSDGNGGIIIGKGGAIQGDTGKGKISPVLDTGIQEDGHFQVLKNNGTKGQISANIKAGTNTTIIDDSIILSEPSGVIISTGSITTLSNFIGGGLELTPTAGGNGGNITVTNVGGGGTGLVTISASGSITASKDITARNLNLSGGFIDLKNDGTQSQIRFYCENNNAHYTKVMAAPHVYYTGNKDLVLPAYDFDFATPAFGTVSAPVNVDVTGKLTTTSITASGAISSSDNIFGNRIIASDYIQSPQLDIGTGTTEIDSTVISLPNLPTSDPGVAGRLWRDGTDLKISVW